MLKERRKARIAKIEQEETDRMAKLKSKDTQKLIEEDACFEKLRLKHELELEVGKKKEKRRLKLKMEKTRNSELLLLHGDKPKLLCFLGKSDQMDGYFFRFEKKKKKKKHTHTELQMICRSVEHLSCFTLERELALCLERPLESTKIMIDLIASWIVYRIW